ncbi:MAG: hypothetical protein HN488_03940 [Saprospiraceae bacterium]|nr:hypothetical protein [Saprospiraceae bacterium]
MSEVIETDKLQQIIGKIENIEQERMESADLLKDVFNEGLCFLTPSSPIFYRI